MRLPLVLAVTLSAVLATASTFHPARRAVAARLTQRQSFTGGFALRADSCPSDVQTCSKIKGQPACCPRGSFCYADEYRIGDNIVACCPEEGVDCTDLLLSIPVCAAPDWVLWQREDAKLGNPFCCEKGKKGYVTDDRWKNPACAEPNRAVKHSASASTILPGTAVESGSTPTNSGGRRASSTGAVNDAAATADAESNSESTTASIASSPNSASSSSKGISTGAIIGIGAAGTVLLIAVIGFGFWCVYRKGKRNAVKLSGSPALTYAVTKTTPEAKMPPVAKVYPPLGLYAEERQHMQQQELDRRCANVAELESERRD